jgi:23S rRNA (pseudouridine1915-N3)-methyltransferase
MRIKIIAIGNKMPSYIQEAINAYGIKLIRAGWNVDIVAIPKSKKTHGMTLNSRIKEDSKSLSNYVDKKNYNILLDFHGKLLSSEQMHKKIMALSNNGIVNIFIGGSDGVDKEFKDSMNELWSISKMTFTHSLARLLVIEQIFRCWAIEVGHSYHK